MALGHRDIPVTREMMSEWLQEWEDLPSRRPAKRKFLADKLEEIEPGLSKATVDTSQRDDYKNDEVSLMDLIFDDLDSYG
jgi:hypothetical protein